MSTWLKAMLALLSVVIFAVGIVLFLTAMRKPYTRQRPNARRMQIANIVILAGIVELALLLTFAPL